MVEINGCWRKWYPYATLIHREADSECLDSLAERLEKAMDCHDPVIIIRCFHLGEVLLAWLNLGHTVRDVGCCFSLSSLVLSSFGKGRLPQLLAMTGLAAQVIHGSVWGSERLSNYSVLPKNKVRERERSSEVHEVVLVRKPSTGSFMLRTAVTLCAVGVCAYFFYKDYAT
ncbi:uncharacterized protein CDAR_426391 [Caerostris darwini]|uniref:Uncharacterized protein n=1 Tax=Caerostris darwini TaxID=1538125 RepID=A0AAV4N9K7_9ARAC|nr:uncharacterized protein CDAR_426391 [Caerostris darwini]